MKKLFFILICFALTSGRIMASEGEPISLDTEFTDNDPTCPSHGKAPMRMPRIYQNGYTLTLSSFHPEYIINIEQDGEIVYSSIIPAGVTEFELPAFVSGECTVQFITGRFCFKGTIYCNC